jgi:hypothetical protein
LSTGRRGCAVLDRLELELGSSPITGNSGIEDRVDMALKLNVVCIRENQRFVAEICHVVTKTARLLQVET